MGTKKGSYFFSAIFAIIIGSGLYRQFDFQEMKFENVSLSIIYGLAFVFWIFMIIQTYKKRKKMAEDSKS